MSRKSHPTGATPSRLFLLGAFESVSIVHAELGNLQNLLRDAAKAIHDASAALNYDTKSMDMQDFGNQTPAEFELTDPAEFDFTEPHSEDSVDTEKADEDDTEQTDESDGSNDHDYSSDEALETPSYSPVRTDSDEDEDEGTPSTPLTPRRPLKRMNATIEASHMHSKKSRPSESPKSPSIRKRKQSKPTKRSAASSSSTPTPWELFQQEVAHNNSSGDESEDDSEDPDYFPPVPEDDEDDSQLRKMVAEAIKKDLVKSLLNGNASALNKFAESMAEAANSQIKSRNTDPSQLREFEY